MVKIFSAIFTASIFFIAGCNNDESPTSPSVPSISSIEDQINAVRPINVVYVYDYNGEGGYTAHTRINPTQPINIMIDAFASKGYLIVKRNFNSDYYYNLSLATEIRLDTDEKNIYLQY